MEPTTVGYITLGTNVGILILGLKFVRHVARMEMKVDMMWSVFVRRFGTRIEKGNAPFDDEATEG